MPTRGHELAIGDILRGKRDGDDTTMPVTPTRNRAKPAAITTVVHLSRDEDTIGSAMSKLARHGILAAPVLDECQGHFFG
jgi:hypothetical protein